MQIRAKTFHARGTSLFLYRPILSTTVLQSLAVVPEQQGLAFRNKTIGPQFARMPRYFFHLDGDVPARDVIGHDCNDDEQAKRDGDFIAHRLGTEKPDMVREGNLVSVTNEDGDKLLQIPLASTTV